MGADKNSSPMRELDLCPKFTNKDSHTSLPRSRSHNGPTNPRNKPQIIPKRKHDSRSKGLSRSARHQAGVCKHWADRPRGLGGPSKNNSQTSSTAPTITDHPWRHLGPSATNSLLADCPRTPGGPSAKPPATEGG
jgi:hypothetical protein